MKDMGKLTMVLIAAVALGAFALPSMLSATGISHSFVNGNDVQCTKCHKSGDTIADAIAGSDKTMYGTDAGGDPDSLAGDSSDGYLKGQTIHGAMVNGCKQCHILASTGGTTLTPDSHTQVTYPDCTNCHVHVPGEIKAPNSDVHKGFQLEAEAQGDNDAACIGCHTQSSVSGSVSYNMNRNTAALYNGALSFGN